MYWTAYASAVALFLSPLFLVTCTSGKFSQAGPGRVLARIKAPVFADKVYDVREYGAVGDGQKDCLPAIAAAILRCTEGGGGKVVFPAGKYLVNGPIHLQDNVCLVVEAEAELIFGTRFSDYLPAVLTRWEGTIIYGYSPLIYAYQKKNIGITGAGTLNGQAATSWSKWQPLQRDGQLLTRQFNAENTPLAARQFGEGHTLRPSFIQFYACENVLVDGITITDSPFWCVHPVFSKNITISNVKFEAHNANNDGIDPDSCEDVYIHHIDFDNHDDNIAIKSGRDREPRELNRPSRNIVIRHCRWKGHNALALGSEMSGGIYNVFAQDCSYRGDVIAGIYLKSNRDRGGEISNVYISNFAFGKCRTAIECITNYKNEGQGNIPLFSSIRIENVSCRSASNGIILEGTPEKPIRNVLLENIRIEEAKTPVKTAFTEAVVFKNVVVNGTEVSR
ncbi:hypothetical protein BH24BAC1_BH24BAC1_36490 [soil metagenome]